MDTSTSGLSAERLQDVEMQLTMLLEGQRQTMKLLDTCFSRCVDTPGNSLTSSQQQCIGNCTKTYLQASLFCTERLRGMAEKELQSRGGAPFAH
ncbi:tim10 ddp family zinc finger superfamily protein [Cystoisospora suis]|uniref:Mitochondrial import inner membrane translocase subunit n=1 Tax=Cystoisospora suis TaxID=483139 RepID=A0A2C6KN63_9APIC|nr:tim10 ddp family zinc finger superfamily protein [Cystoisospora suis]